MTEKDSSRPADLTAYKSFIRNLAVHLTAANIDELKFLSDLPGECQQIKNGLQFFIVLSRHGKISFKSDGLDYLSELLKCIQRRDLYGKVKTFVEERKRIENPEAFSKKSDPAVPEEERSSTKKASCDPERVALPTAKTPTTKGKAASEDVSTRSEIQNTSKLGGSLSPKESSILCSDEQLEPNLSSVTEPENTNHEKPNMTYALPSVDSSSQVQYAVPPFSSWQYYEMGNDPRGYCLIFNNEDFKLTRAGNENSPSDDSGLDDRTGTAVDVEQLAEVFTNLKFKVEKFEDKTADQMVSVLEQYANSNHTNYDCFVVCILSHGCYDGVYGIDGEVVRVNTIHHLFKNCPSLKGKPKLFFFQFCRGDNEDKVASDGFVPSFKPQDNPTEADFYMACATPPGYVSWRSKVHGTWFVSKLCQALSEHPDWPIGDLMVQVTAEVTKGYTMDGYKQTPQVITTLTKKLKFT